MRAIELFQNFPEVVERLRAGFGGLLETAKDVEVIPWRKEFEERDKNPEVFFQIEELRRKLSSGEISEETFRREMERLARVPTSVTMGVAFIRERKVSFRDVPPSADVLVHEVGHVHFGVGDLFWSSAYGGGEILVWAHIKGLCESDEERVRDFLSFYELCVRDPERAHQVLLERLWPFMRSNKIAPHVGALMEFFGCLIDTDLPFDPSDHAWLEFPVKESHMTSFVAEVTAGICVKDPSFFFLAKKMGWIL